MEIATAPATDAASQRRSGRVVRPPSKYITGSATPAVKRKRPNNHGHDSASDMGEGASDDDNEIEIDEEDDGDADDDNEDDEDDEDDDEDERRHRRARYKRKASNGKATAGGASVARRAAKKPKLNGASHAASLPTRPKKSVRVAIEADGEHGGQLYADIFASGEDSADVAARWYKRYQENNAAAVADLVNCILSAAGCDHHVTEDDINDPDNCSNRLTELQGIYEDQKIIDYPLIAKARSTKPFRELLVQFFHAFINVLHETETLYNQAELMENVVRWVASLSSSTLRPFRHTATTVALSMLAALVDVAKKLDERTSKMTQQVEGQKGRHNKSKAKDSRLVAFQANLREAIGNRDRVAELMKEFFDTVFVHRYRDIDPRIRTECVEALGSWVWSLPTLYLQPEYLRYLGWMLSDSYPATRQEVLRQVARVFRRDAGKLGHFIDRFKGRLVEMATKDADIGVRVAAISACEQLRPSGLMEPDEIDQIAKLIFDSELRIRKAVVSFFAECVQEFAAIKLDEVGGEEAMQELFGKRQSRTGQLDAPRRDWVHIKSLADAVCGYEQQLGMNQTGAVAYGLEAAAEIASAVVPETSRLALATQVLVDKIPEITNWEILAGYLLFDHSVTTSRGGRGRNTVRTTETKFRAAVAPDEQQEAMLLEILAAAAKATLAPGQEGDRLRRRFGGVDATATATATTTATAAASASTNAENAEAAALQLAGLLPRLLRKFGAEPSTAVTVLRLQQSLNLEVFRHLRQDTATFESLLEEVCTQFQRHADMGVVSEAAAVLLHARQHDELEEVVDGKVATLWESGLNALRNIDQKRELSVRGNLKAPLAIELSVTLFKISKLASISDCVDVLEAEGTSTSAESTSSAAAIDILVKTVRRGKFEEVNEELDNIEDGLVMHAIAACQFYFMWKMRALALAVEAKTEVPSAAVDGLAIRKRAFDQNVVHTFSSRGYNDDLRLYATGAYCDLHVLFASLRKRLSAPAVMARYVSLGRLIDQVPAGLTGELISIFDAMERTFAKKTKKTLNDPAEDEDPAEDPLDDDSEDEEDESGEDGPSAEEKRAAELKAERALCDLTSHYVMAIVARVLDQTGAQAGKLKRRLLRNQTKLGHSYKEIVAFLDEKKASEALLANNRKKGGSGGSSSRVRKTATTGTGGAGGDRPQTAGGGGGGGGGGGSGGVTFAADVNGGDHGDGDGDGEAGDGDFGGILLGAPTPAADLDDDELDDLLDTPEPEEGTLEDLQRRELVDVALDDEEEEEKVNGGNMDEDEVLGD